MRNLLQHPELPHHFFDIISNKPFNRQDLYINWEDYLPEISPARKQLEDYYWESYQKQNPQSHLFNGILCQLRHYDFDTSPAQLTLGPIHFKTHFFSIQKGRNLSEQQNGRMMGLGVSSVLISSDDQIVFIKRSNEVAANAGQFDVFGGHIDPDHHESLQSGGDLVPNPFTAIFQELVEEANINLETITNLEGLGLISNYSTSQYELVFRCLSTIDAKTIVKNAQGAQDCSEYSHIICVPNNSKKLELLCSKYAKDFSPSGLGSLWLHYLNQEIVPQSS
jgi:hypothetical protein